MSKRGRRRSKRDLPSGIDPAKLPTRCYWDSSGNGHWYTVYRDESGRQRRKKIAGPKAALSDLHRLMEELEGVKRDTFAFLSDQFHASPQFSRLAPSTKKGYEYCRRVVSSHPTRMGVRLGEAPLSRWSRPMVQRLTDQLTTNNGPSTAAHVLRYLRRLFEWGVNRGHATTNPARGVEAPQERKQRRLPSLEAHNAVLEFARSRGGHLWIAMELAYLLRLRGIEVVTLTDAHSTPEGVLVERRKGSRGNITEWAPRLRTTWEAAEELRREQVERWKLPIPMNPERRWLFLASDGDHLRKSSLDTAWQRMIRAAIKEGVITTGERFSLHDLKRAGVTRTPGTWAEKQQASGHKDDSMREVYDLSLPRVRPTEE